MTKKNQKIIEEIQKLEQENGELLMDLQRTRADFENYRKNVDEDRRRTKNSTERSTIFNLLDVVDDIDRATSHLPANLAKDAWAQGVITLNKKLAVDLKKLGLEKIALKSGDLFNPELHEAVLVDEESSGDQEVVTEVLRTGYVFKGEVLRPATVKVKYQ